MVAKRSSLWFGFLEAGDKGSPVIADRSLDVPARPTIYLFNLKKGKFVEYRRDIVEAKLRELAPEEMSLIDELKTAYELARPDFKPRWPVPSPTRSKPRRQKAEIEEPDQDFDADLPLFEPSEDLFEAGTED